MSPAKPAGQRPPPRMWRSPGFIIALSAVVVLALIITLGVLSMWALVENVRRGGEPEEDFYTPIADTGGPAQGQAQVFSQLLRARGLACSDENLEKVFSRGCFRRDFDHKVRVEFIGPVDGSLGTVNIDLDFIGAEDKTGAHRAFDELVGDFVEAADMSAADTGLVRTKLAGGGDVTFSTDWGTGSLRRYTDATSSITFQRGSWRSSTIDSATLPGDVSMVEPIAVDRGYLCDHQYGQIDCTKGDGDEFHIVASNAVPSGGLSRLYVRADTGRDDTAMDIALSDAGSVLDILGGSRAAAAKEWMTNNRTAAGGIAYVGGLHVSLSVEDTRQSHIVQLEVTSPCRYTSDGGTIC